MSSDHRRAPECNDDTFSLPMPLSPEQDIKILAAGDVLGSYRVLRKIGQGGMGCVYEVAHIHLNKRYALKVLSHADPLLLERFKIEARVMADMLHPNIIRVHQMEVDEEKGLCYFVMDYVCGRVAEGESKALHSLADYISQPGQRLQPERVKEVLLDICSALEYAHSFNDEGVIHRDLKPSNILIDENGSAYITDFGIAKILGQGYYREIIEKSHSLSIAPGKGGDVIRSLVGTIEFMAPEQRQGAAVSAQSDIYSVGVIIYRLLTGYLPAGAWKAPSLCGVGCSAAWDVVVDKCLAPHLQERYKSVRELKDEIHKIAALSHSRKKLFLSVAVIGLLLITIGSVYARRVAVRPHAPPNPVISCFDLGHMRSWNGISCELTLKGGGKLGALKEIPCEVALSLDEERWAILSGALIKEVGADLHAFRFNKTMHGRHIRLKVLHPELGNRVAVKKLNVL